MSELAIKPLRLIRPTCVKIFPTLHSIIVRVLFSNGECYYSSLRKHFMFDNDVYYPFFLTEKLTLNIEHYFIRDNWILSKYETPPSNLKTMYPYNPDIKPEILFTTLIPENLTNRSFTLEAVVGGELVNVLIKKEVGFDQNGFCDFLADDDKLHNNFWVLNNQLIKILPERTSPEL